MRQLSKNKVINKLANELIDQYGWTLRPKRNSPHNVIVDPNTHYSYPIHTPLHAGERRKLGGWHS